MRFVCPETEGKEGRRRRRPGESCLLVVKQEPEQQGKVACPRGAYKKKKMKLSLWAFQTLEIQNEKFLFTRISSTSPFSPRTFTGKLGRLCSASCLCFTKERKNSLSLLLHTSAVQPSVSTWTTPGYVKIWALLAAFYLNLCVYAPFFFPLCHSSAKSIVSFWRTLTSVIYFVATIVCLFFDSCCGLAYLWKFQRAKPASPPLPDSPLQDHAIFSSRFLGFHEQLVACSWGFIPQLAHYLKWPITTFSSLLACVKPLSRL